MSKKKVKIRAYTDGACSGNPGPGGWAGLLLIKGVKAKDKVVVKGGEKHTTNNRMELVAVIESLKFIWKNMGEFNYDVRVYCDSSYVVNSVNNGYLKKWNHNGWQTIKGKSVINQDLWEELLALVTTMKPQLIKVKGHSGDRFNEYVDNVAVEERNKYQKLLNVFDNSTE